MMPYHIDTLERQTRALVEEEPHDNCPKQVTGRKDVAVSETDIRHDEGCEECKEEVLQRDESKFWKYEKPMNTSSSLPKASFKQWTMHLASPECGWGKFRR